MTVFLTIVLTLFGLLIIGGAYMLWKTYEFYTTNVTVLSQCYQLLQAMAQFRGRGEPIHEEEYEEDKGDEGESPSFGLNM